MTAAAVDRCRHCRKPLVARGYVERRTGQTRVLLVCRQCDQLALWPVLKHTATSE